MYGEHANHQSQESEVVFSRGRQHVDRPGSGFCFLKARDPFTAAAKSSLNDG
jgi:hypothetical protein